jgi:hypothetical protein
MKKYLLIILILFSEFIGNAQGTTYGGGGSPVLADGATISDFSPDGTLVLPDGSVTLQNNSTYYHMNRLLTNHGFWSSTTGSMDMFIGSTGTGTNTIAGTVVPNFFNVDFSIGAAADMVISNSQGINIANNLAFNNRYTTTVRSNHQAGAVRFLDGAGYANTSLGDGQHVNGYVSKRGNDAFVFPVGSGADLRTLSISAPASAADEYSVAWIQGDPTPGTDPSDGAGSAHPITNLSGPIVSVSPVGQWDWILVNGTGAGLTVTASIPDMTGFAVAPNLRLAGWNGSAWINLSSAGAASGNLQGSTLVGTMVAGITAIGIASVSFVLPVSLVSFNASMINCEAVLDWKTASESNSSKYEIEYSTDGIRFGSIGNIANRNSADGSAYKFTFAGISAGRNYFRLRSIDIDGRSTTSDVVLVSGNCKGSPAITIGPNPATDVINVFGLSGCNTIVIMDLTGRQVVNLVSNRPTETINLSGLTNGAYIVRIINENKIVTNIKLMRE